MPRAVKQSYFFLSQLNLIGMHGSANLLWAYNKHANRRGGSSMQRLAVVHGFGRQGNIDQSSNLGPSRGRTCAN